jgi:hypothetical protein
MRPDQRFFVDFFCTLAHPEPGYKEQLIGLVDSEDDVKGQYEKLDGLRAKLEHRFRALQCARSPYTGYRIAACLAEIKPRLYLLSMACLIRGFRETSAEELQAQLLSSALTTPGAMLSRPAGDSVVLP